MNETMTQTLVRRALRFVLLLGFAIPLKVSAVAEQPVGRPGARPWNRDVIYFAMTDRFCDGDSANNSPTGCDPALQDPQQQDINRYHGGDLRGLELAIRDGYFNDLGVTALWITPPVRNAWRSPYDMGGPKTGYHGYWTQDFLDIDPHLVSRSDLNGQPYTDDREGRMAHYRDFVSLAHRHGLKVIQDAVCNHVGPLFYYDANGNMRVDLDQPQEWIAPFRDAGYRNTRWMNLPQWNLNRPQPGGAVQVHGKSIPTTGLFQSMAVYGRRGFNPDSLGKSDGEEVVCDFFALRDFYTGPDSDHFDALVDEFVSIYAFYIETIGVDGLRLDTVKHVHHEFWTAFTQRLRQRLGDRADEILITGEVYDGNPKVLGRYTYSIDPGTGERTKETCLDSLLNFQFCFNLRDYLRLAGDQYGTGWGLEQTSLALNQTGDDAFYNSSPGLDGLAPRQKMVNFFENHDGLNRFLVKDVDKRKHQLALATLMTFEGIPCVYYGAEAALRDNQGQLGQDGETGRLTFAKQGDLNVLQQARQSETFQMLSQLAQVRREHRVLTDGRMVTLWADSDQISDDDGLFVFARYYESDQSLQPGEAGFALVAINANPNASAVAEKVTLPFMPETALATGVDLENRSLVPSVSTDAPVRPVRILGGSDKAMIRVEVPPSSAILILGRPSA